MGQGQQREEATGIRSQLRRIVLIPGVTFVVLFCVLSGAALIQAVSLKLAAVDGRAAADLYQASTQLQEERRLALVYLGETDQGSDTEDEPAGDALRSQFVATDDSLRDVGDRARGLTSRGAPEVREHAAEFLDALEGRDSLREDVLNGEQDRLGASNAYTELIDAGHRLFDASGRNVQDAEAVAMASATQDVVRGQEALAQADAVLSGAVAAEEFTPQEQARITGLVEHGTASLETASGRLTDDNEETLTALVEGTDWQNVQATTNEVATNEPIATVDSFGVPNSPDRTVPVDIEQWRTDMDAVSGGLVGLAEAQWREQLDCADVAGTNHLTWSVGGGIFSLFAAALAYGVASRSSKELIDRLRRLRRDVLERSERDLPRIVGQLERGERVDPGDDVQPLDHGEDEIGEVANAFNAAQRTAVASAVRQVEIREGANRVFLAIAHRNQSLVQRQLELLDRIERDQEDPDLLSDLFQLDHLATRGRRHAENLIILGNGRPGRQWRDPVPLTDVIRGAISETEEYARIKLRNVPEVSIVGSAVGDVIHLIAELAENATSFSPPHTVVHVSSELVPKGLVIEVEDRGLGMEPEDVDRANRAFASPPQFDVVAPNNDSRLGLFVVARLAAKHQIAVQLRGSPYGGMRAIVLVPARLVAQGRPSYPATPRDGVPRPPTGPNDTATGAQRQTTPGTFEREPGRNTQPEGVPSAEIHTLGVSVPKDPFSEPNRRPSPTGGEQRPALPRRQRQASLAPQLRTTPTVSEGAPAPRTASDVRQTMTALQTGTRRGRQQDSDLVRRTEGEARPDTARRTRSGDNAEPAGDAEHTENVEHTEGTDPGTRPVEVETTEPSVGTRPEEGA
ncbi:nitrate- and nitrite sensing domain-containing protein [Spiractinospora alimapuensis]|uniref:sensor histidine kinase n=1 Tax=Spiractinospora alimapuensis TaxID=2820884 RepID=UPI001F48006E|nr:nitrate- and nitrite sensing domain-containing protein [Spiractinospora alimapuensis]QVQ52084.1 nitrate- and nitrite sensing domain-containing protein [Spiractinospora alimapuensis]